MIENDPPPTNTDDSDQGLYSFKNTPAMLVFAVLMTVIYLFFQVGDSDDSFAFAMALKFNIEGVGWLIFGANLITYQFAHDSFFHLADNLFFLLIFGGLVEERIGTKKFVLFYLGIGALAGLSMGIGEQDPIFLIGASGSISGICGIVLATHSSRWIYFPPKKWNFPFQLGTPIWLVMGFWAVGQIFENSGPISSVDPIAYTAHLSGFVLGLISVPLFQLANAPQNNE